MNELIDLLHRLHRFLQKSAARTAGTAAAASAEGARPWRFSESSGISLSCVLGAGLQHFSITQNGGTLHRLSYVSVQAGLSLGRVGRVQLPRLQGGVTIPYLPSASIGRIYVNPIYDASDATDPEFFQGAARAISVGMLFGHASAEVVAICFGWLAASASSALCAVPPASLAAMCLSNAIGFIGGVSTGAGFVSPGLTFSLGYVAEGGFGEWLLRGLEPLITAPDPAWAAPGGMCRPEDARRGGLPGPPAAPPVRNR